jgi:hypothetical protein
MQRLLISYDFRGVKRTETNRKDIYAELDSLGAVQIQESLWVVSTEMSVTYVTTKLHVHFSPTDRLLVAELGTYKSRQGISKLPRL